MSFAEGVTLDRIRGREARPGLALVSLMLVIASFQLNATMFSPAIGDMAERLDTNAGVIGWSSTVFLAVSAALAILMPPVADKIGRRRGLLISVVLMSVGTVILLVTGDVVSLMIGRALQGFCGATFALSNLTLRAMLEPKRYAVYVAWVAAVNAGIGGIDTLVGGVLVDSTGYKGIVVTVLVIELLALAAIALFVPETRVPAAQRMDWGGAVSLTGALWSLNMFLTFGFGTVGWGSLWTILMLVLAVVFGIAFFVIERSVQAPLLPIDELRKRSVWGQVATTFFTLMSAFAVLFYLIPAIATDAENGLGLSGTLSALLYLMPFSLLGWAVAPVVGFLAPRVGYRIVLRVGLLGSTVLIAIMMTGLQSMWMLFALSTLMGATYAGISNTVLNTLGVLYASPARPGVLPGLTSASFNLGSGVGTGVMASVVALHAVSGDAQQGYFIALTIGLVAAVIALLFSFALPGRVSENEKI